MTDHELIRAAAANIGLKIIGPAEKALLDPGHRAGGLYVETPDKKITAWNPLTDSGDALGLAVGAHISIDTSTQTAIAGHGAAFPGAANSFDRMANIRRVITMAAASVG